MKIIIAHIIALLLCAAVAQAQTDSLIWNENLSFTIDNKPNNNPCNNFAIGYMQLSSPTDSAVYFRAIISQDQSWFCSGIDDDAESALAFYLLSITELWTRQLCIYNKNNSGLPADYLRAYREDGWEKHQKRLVAEQVRFGHGEDTTGLARAIAETIRELRETPSLIIDSRATNYGYGMDFFASAAHIPSNMFTDPIGMGISLQFFVKQTGIKLQGNMMYGTTATVPMGSTLLRDGQHLQHGEFSLQIEQRVVDNYRISVAPFIGYGFYEIQVSDSASTNEHIGKKTPRITNFAPSVGVNIDFKLRGQLLDTERRFGQDSYWLVRTGVFYTPFMSAESQNFSYLGFKIGLGGFSRFWK